MVEWIECFENAHRDSRNDHETSCLCYSFLLIGVVFLITGAIFRRTSIIPHRSIDLVRFFGRRKVERGFRDFRLRFEFRGKSPRVCITRASLIICSQKSSHLIIFAIIGPYSCFIAIFPPSSF